MSLISAGNSFNTKVGGKVTFRSPSSMVFFKAVAGANAVIEVANEQFTIFDGDEYVGIPLSITLFQVISGDVHYIAV